MTDEEEFSARTSGWGPAVLHHVLRILARISCGISSLVGSAHGRCHRAELLFENPHER